jgi:hypothetical protein
MCVCVYERESKLREIACSPALFCYSRFIRPRGSPTAERLQPSGGARRTQYAERITADGFLLLIVVCCFPAPASTRASHHLYPSSHVHAHKNVCWLYAKPHIVYFPLLTLSCTRTHRLRLAVRTTRIRQNRATIACTWCATQRGGQRCWSVSYFSCIIVRLCSFSRYNTCRQAKVIQAIHARFFLSNLQHSRHCVL